MLSTQNIYSECYQIPSESVLEHRKTFYLSQKENTESNLEWFGRAQQLIDGCDFIDLAEFLLIDKFICTLQKESVEKLRALQISSSNCLYDSLANDSINTETNNENEGDYKPDIIVDEESKVETALLIDNNTKDENAERPVNLLELKSEPNPEPEIVEPFVRKSARKRKLLEKDNWLKVDTRKKRIEKKTKKRKKYENIKGFSINEENRVVCLDCGKTFAHRSSYIFHRQKHFEHTNAVKKTHRCEICDREFWTPAILRRHMFQHKLEGKTFECHLCRSAFPIYRNLRVHFFTSHTAIRNTKYICKQCDKRHTCPKSLDDHIQKVHGLEVNHKCPHCDEEFNEFSKLESHLEQIHAKSKRFICELCAKRFPYRNKLMKHVREAHSDERYECSDCGKLFKRRQSFLIHYRLHTGERPYACNLCPRKFTSGANYYKHMQVHQGIRNHACSLCDKRFATSYDLRIHTSVHTGARPFACDMCDKKFTQSAPLKAHKRKVHPGFESNTK